MREDMVSRRSIRRTANVNRGPGASPEDRARGKSTVRSFFTDDNHVLYHLWSLICGLSLVMPLCVGLIKRFPLHFRYQPTGVGIISLTTLTHYPPKQEVYHYVLALAVLIVVPGLVWLAWLVCSLSLARLLGRDFGTVATRGCWALSLFVLVFPYALLYAWDQPLVTFAVLAGAAVVAPVVQVALVLALPQRLDRELDEVEWLAGTRWVRRLPRRLAAPAEPTTSLLGRAFLIGTAGAWILYLTLAGRGGDGAAVAVMTALVLTLPLLFLAGWIAWVSRLQGGEGEPGEAPGPASALTGLVLLLGLGLVGYLYALLSRSQEGALEVMLAVVTLLAALVVWPGVWGWLRGGRRWLRVAAAVAAVLVALTALALVTFEPSFLSEPASLDPDFLREDGAHLAWANALLRGRLQGRGFYSMYGPLLHYGLVATMRVVGVRAEAAPLYWWVGRTVGAVAAVLLLWQLTGSALFAVLAVCVLHTGVGWRTAPALASLAAFTHFSRTRRPFWALLAGLLIGVALALSHEFGLCALVACGAGTAVLAWRYETRRLAGAGLGSLLLGTGLVLSTVAAHFALAGVLSDVVGDLVQHARYVLMGYGNLPFPNLFPFLAQDRPVWQVVTELLRGGRLHWYFPIMVWVVTLHLVLFRYVMGRATARDLGALSVMVFGVLAYRVVLARSDVIHLHLVMPVATVLFLWHVWLLLGRLGTVFARARLRVINVVEFLALSAAAVFLFDGATLAGARVAVLWGQMGGAARALVAVPAHLRAPSQLERAVVPPGRTNTVAQVVRYVQERTSPLEPVLAVPNIPVFYFLADRPNPTRFGQMAQLVTNEHRVEAFRQLERQPPSLVLFHGGNDEVDNIPATRQFPNVLARILTHYERADKFGPIYVLRRRSAQRVPAATLAWKADAGLRQWRAHGDVRRVRLEADGTYAVRPGDRPVTFTVELDEVPGQAYRTLRVHLLASRRGSAEVSWLTREPLHAEEKVQAALSFPATRREAQTADLDLRDHPSWLFNHIRRLSVTIPAQYAVTVEGFELLPVGLGPEEPRPSSSAAPAPEAPVKDHQ